VRSRDLVVGNRYRIRYRLFSPTNNCNYGYKLMDGEGVLSGIYTAGYNHTFKLDDGQEVWATPNSIFELGNEPPQVSLVSDVAGVLSRSDILDIETFLTGIEIDANVVDDHLVIPPHSMLKFKNLIHNIYSRIL
jgi:hypothetical protein